ncbi:MAG TPA: bifunctional ADP-heptose synthase [Chthonomonadaceae bacterium]|nr:bifunctional ADP-heptose synthase [Chthonomonadaceae bacterium]
MDVRLSEKRRWEIIDRFASRSVLVVGDLMADEYLYGSARRISQEGPVMVIEVDSDEFKPGGAANVANNLRALGAAVAVAGVIGDDAIGRTLVDSLDSSMMDVSSVVVDVSRPTTRKTRVVAQSQQVLRVDREKTSPISPGVAEALLGQVSRILPNVDGVLVSDYRKGVVTPQSAAALIDLARSAGKPLITNPKPQSAVWLRGARVLSLNQIEAEGLGGGPLPDDEQALRAFGERLAALTDADALMVTRGSRGLCLWQRSGAFHAIPAHLVEVADIAGAGDTTIGTMALALLSGASDVEAAELANLAGACVVRKHGVATISPDELRSAI